MSHVDLSTLRGPELRRMLDSARQRGDATLSYEILQEMAARRERTGSGRRRSSGPRIVELTLGDSFDDPADAPREPPAWDDPDLTAEPPPPEEEATYLQPLTPPPLTHLTPARPRVRRWPWAGGGLVVGLVLGLALGGWATEISFVQRPPAVAPVAVTPPAPASPPAATPTPEATTADAITPAAEAPPETPAPPPPPPAAPTAEVPPEVAQPAEVPAVAASAAKGCASAPTPADQAICGDPKLQRLQRELRQAYAEALDAHQDRDLLRQRQLAWRDARNAIADPDRLAQLYEERIRKLNAAAEAARQQR